jgi:hypothetical protein
MTFFLQIRTSTGPLSTFKPGNPKMMNAMKALCVKYENMFKTKCTVQRFIPTPKGMKKI